MKATAPTPRWKDEVAEPVMPTVRSPQAMPASCPTVRPPRPDGSQGRRKKGLNPLGRYVGMAVAGTEPDEMGIGPVFAIPKLLNVSA
jgi:acetyl-CoA acetyltransferase